MARRAPGRGCHTLFGTDGRGVQGSDDLKLPLRLGQLAASLGMRGETLSRQLADWRRQGLIAGRGTAVSLLDADALRRLRSAR